MVPIWNVGRALHVWVLTAINYEELRFRGNRSPKRTADQAAVLPHFILPVARTQAMIYHYYTKVGVGV